MMKYIRTEDGIYEDAGTDALGWRCVRYKGNRIVLSKDDDKIVKEADTIEELCDVFVSECEVLGNIMQDYIYDFGIFKKRWFEGYNAADFYGAIKVKGKGLIYVAKMNEKEELELI